MRKISYFIIFYFLLAPSAAFAPFVGVKNRAVGVLAPPPPVLVSNGLLQQSFNNRRQGNIRKNTMLAMSQEKNVSDSSTGPSPIVAIFNLFAINEVVKLLFAKYAITFPASLAGCGALLATFLFVPSGELIYNQFAPGAQILAKWLPVFFVPSLVTLPLSNSIGSPVEILKVSAVIIGGLLFSLYSTAFSVLAVKKIAPSPQEPPKEEVKPLVVDIVPPPTPKAFSDETTYLLKSTALLSALFTILSRRLGLDVADDLARVFLTSLTLSTFTFGARLPKKFTKVVHPLITCTGLSWGAMWILGKLTLRSFSSMLLEYKAPAGAGPILLGFLGPSVVSLACQMFDRRKLIKKNIIQIAAAILVSSFGGVFGTAAAVRLLCIGSPSLRLSLLSRNITSPLAMTIASILGGDVSLAVSIVVITGLIGANFGASLLDVFRIKDAAARGLGIGAAAHGLGTAAFANEKDAFPFAAIAMALTASASTILVSVPMMRQAVLRVALG